MSQSEDMNNADLYAKAVRICGADNVSIEESERAFFSSDLYQAGELADIVISPSSANELSQITTLAARHARSLYVRGGGRSYSNAFLPQAPGGILIDMSRLKSIREINTEDFYVTVEAGCTWMELDEALHPHGLRSVFWGPASGRHAQIGGSMSQGTANNNAGSMETSSTAVLSYEIVTGDGSILRTGLDAQAGRVPNFRPYGPDLTALFNADAGAFGIKTAITLKLEPKPSAQGGVSFAFSSFADLKTAMRAAAETGLATAIIAMDAETAQIRSGKSGLAEDFKKFLTIVRSAHNPGRGIARGLKIALAGRKVFEQAKYTAHFLAEASNNTLLAATERGLRAAIEHGEAEIPSAAISMMRAELFPDLATTHFDGRRMIPVHGIFPWSQLEAFQSAYSELIKKHQSAIDSNDIVIADILSVLGRSSILFEPVFYWTDRFTDYHLRTRNPSVHGPAPDHSDNPDARAIVEQLKTEIISLMAEHGAAHMQIGKLYPFMDKRSAENTAFLKDLKATLDPDGIINPGALGL